MAFNGCTLVFESKQKPSKMNFFSSGVCEGPKHTFKMFEQLSGFFNTVFISEKNNGHLCDLNVPKYKKVLYTVT